MLLKLGKAEINIHGGLVFLGLLVADSMYANHCKAKMFKHTVEKKSEETEKKAEVETEEES